MADVTITAAEVGLLDALPGGLLGLGVFYVPAAAPVHDDAGVEVGSVGQDHGTLAAFSDAPTGALDVAAKALDQVRADAPARAAAVLPNLKADLKTQVDAAAEALRLTLITPGSGQAMEYQEAFNEAVQVSNTLAANPGAAIDPAKFPMLSASLGFDTDPSTGKPTVDVPGEARAVLAAYDAYQRAGAAIRNVRLKGKAAIDAAATGDAARAAYAAIVWPSLA